MAKANRKKIITILMGNALEYYDSMLYGFFAASLAPLFFPNENPTISFISAIGSYGITFLARPLGGAVFGHFGDRLGRKNTFSVTMLLLAMPTMGIALLPTYDSIGIFAPILLVTFRFLQGFCLGGETSGAMTYLIEGAPSNLKDRYSAFLVSSCYIGVLIGTLLGAFFTLSFMPEWGWRLTFALGSLVAIIGYFVRQKLKESETFKEIQQAGTILKVPFRSLIKNDKISLLQSACMACGVVSPFFITFIYLPGLLVKDYGWEPTPIMILHSLMMVVAVAFLAVGHVFIKMHGREKVMKFGALAAGLLSYPLFSLMETYPHEETIIAVQFILIAFAMLYAGTTSSFLVDLFPSNCRYSGIAVGYATGHALFGGLVPVIMTTLAQVFGMSEAPAVFLIVGSVAGYWAVYKGENDQAFQKGLSPQKA